MIDAIIELEKTMDDVFSPNFCSGEFAWDEQNKKFIPEKRIQNHKPQTTNHTKMKSKIIEKPKTELEYPILMELINKDREAIGAGGLIVLFISQKIGTVVGNSTNVHRLGFHSDFWSKAEDEKVWKRFEGKIELSNN